MEILHIKFYLIFIFGLIPLVVGFIWYNPKVLGTAWMNASGMTMEKAKSANMAKMLILTYVCSCLAGFMLYPIVIHQMGFFSLILNQLNDPATKDATTSFAEETIAKFGNEFRTFKHGALHGFLMGLFFVTPVIAVGSLYELKSFKYIAIQGGYWIVSLALMGGAICAFS